MNSIVPHNEMANELSGQVEGGERVIQIDPGSPAHKWRYHNSDYGTALTALLALECAQ